MTTHSLLFVFRSAALALLMFQVGCATSQASKVPCDSNLRPINPAISDKP